MTDFIFYKLIIIYYSDLNKIKIGMQSYFYESNNDDITSPKLFLEGGTPNVDPKIGSNSEVRY